MSFGPPLLKLMPEFKPDSGASGTCSDPTPTFGALESESESKSDGNLFLSFFSTRAHSQVSFNFFEKSTCLADFRSDEVMPQPTPEAQAAT